MPEKQTVRQPGGERLDNQPADFDPVADARRLLRTVRSGALATIDAGSGYPFATLVSVATDLDGSPVVRLYPKKGSAQWDTWWDFSPDVLVRFLEILGFENSTMSEHEQRLVTTGGEHMLPMFTLVAERTIGQALPASESRSPA